MPHIDSVLAAVAAKVSPERNIDVTLARLQHATTVCTRFPAAGEYIAYDVTRIFSVQYAAGAAPVQVLL